MNKVILIGKLGQDPELAYTPSGSAVCKLSLATNEGWTDKEGNKQTSTEWHRVVVWGAQAESSAKYLSKGSALSVEGKVETREWEDKTGNKRYTTEIKAERVRFLGGNNENK